jgi:hypothetical protein
LTYDDIKKIAGEYKTKFKEADIEVYGLGQDCAGRSHRWWIDD